MIEAMSQKECIVVMGMVPKYSLKSNHGLLPSRTLPVKSVWARIR